MVHSTSNGPNTVQLTFTAVEGGRGWEIMVRKERMQSILLPDRLPNLPHLLTFPPLYLQDGLDRTMPAWVRNQGVEGILPP